MEIKIHNIIAQYSHPKNNTQDVSKKKHLEIESFESILKRYQNDSMIELTSQEKLFLDLGIFLNEEEIKVLKSQLD